MSRFPWITINLTVLTVGLMFLPASIHQRLYFDYAAIINSSPLTLLSGHWIHTDWEHLAWNALAFALLASVIENRSRILLLSSLLMGTVIVDLMLLSPFSPLAVYCGLSGVLNTLMGVVLVIYWRETRSRLVILAALFTIGKIGIETYSGNALFTHIAWPPFAYAHLAGLLGTPLAILLHRVWLTHFRLELAGFVGCITKRQGDKHGGLVTGKLAGKTNA